jgi:Ca2+-binding RTX toxin-like protein
MTMAIRFVGPETLVNTTSLDDQFGYGTATLVDGRYVSVWMDWTGSNQRVKAQIFDAAGTKVGAELSVSPATSHDEEASVAALADGGFIISYTRQINSGGDIPRDVIAARYDAAGIKHPGEVAIATAPNLREEGSNIAASGSGYAVVYGQSEGGDGGVALKVFDGNDVQIGTTVNVSSNPTALQSSANITRLIDGNLVVTWRDYSNSDRGLHARIFSESGVAVTDEISISKDTNTASVAALDNGGFAVTWFASQSAASYPDVSGTSIQARFFDAGGTALTNQFTVNSTTAEGQFGPTVTALAGDLVMIGWRGPNPTGPQQTLAQVVGYGASGLPEFHGPETMINRYPSTNGAGEPELSTLHDGRVVASWTDKSGTLGDTSGFAVHQTLLDPLAGIIYGTASDDVIRGQQNDTNEIHGMAGNDILIGGNASDQIYGEAGNDWIETIAVPRVNRLYGGAGDDSYVVHSHMNYVREGAGEGFDVVYADSTDYSLLLGTGGSGVEALVIRSDNHIGTGTDHADLLIAQGNNIQLFGGGDNDTLEGRGTGDILYGGVGHDIYVVSTRSVVIREAPGQGTDTVYATDTDFSLADAPNVETLVLRGINHTGTGSVGADVLISAGYSNALFGGDGNDTFSFTPARGATQVLDFDARPGEHDLLAFTRSQFADFAAVQAHTSQNGADAVITAADGSGDTYVLHNVAAASLSSTDFLFF